MIPSKYSQLPPQKTLWEPQIGSLIAIFSEFFAGASAPGHNKQVSARQEVTRMKSK